MSHRVGGVMQTYIVGFFNELAETTGFPRHSNFNIQRFCALHFCGIFLCDEKRADMINMRLMHIFYAYE